jgi:hypothetical protein
LPQQQLMELLEPAAHQQQISNGFQLHMAMVYLLLLVRAELAIK